MDKRVVILGGGLAGVSMARLLAPHFKDIVIVELTDRLGGLCKTDNIGGVDVDISGGHIFQSKNKEVCDFVFGALPQENWVQSRRNAKIFIDNRLIGFPFELNMCQLGWGFAKKCIAEMRELARHRRTPRNLHEYLLFKYGPLACRKYYFPYNQKIWECPLDEIGINWMQPHKVPMEDIDAIEQANLSGGGQNDTMTHNTFWYPRSGGIQRLMDALMPENVETICNADVRSIRFEYNSGHNVDIHDVKSGNRIANVNADIIVNTIPINYLLKACRRCLPLHLPYHGTDFVICRTDFFVRNPDVSWVYLPGHEHRWHKMSHLAYLTGQPGEHEVVLVDSSFENFKENQELFLPGYKFEILDVRRHAMTYPVEPTGDMMARLYRTVCQLRQYNIYNVGRWAEHAYANMNVVLQRAWTMRDLILDANRGE